jgi:hypothetical protein
VTSSKLIGLSADKRALYFVYAKALNVLRQAEGDQPESKTRISLSNESDELNIRDIVAISTTKVLVWLDKGRDFLTVKSKEASAEVTYDDTISQRSMVSTF